MLNTPSFAWVTFQGLEKVTQKHLKATFPKSSGNEVAVPCEDVILYACFYILASQDPKSSAARF